MITLICLSLIAINGIAAFQPAVLISPASHKRSVSLKGGWGTNQFNENCPVGSTHCFINGCCPSSLDCLGTDDPDNVICCPSGSSCETTLQIAPACADSSWSLWNSTTQGAYGGFFCCVGDQVGDTGGNCNPSGSPLIASSQAILLNPATPTPTQSQVDGIYGGFVSSAVASVTAKASGIVKSAAAGSNMYVWWGPIGGAFTCLLAALL